MPDNDINDIHLLMQGHTDGSNEPVAAYDSLVEAQAAAHAADPSGVVAFVFTIPYFRSTT